MFLIVLISRDICLTKYVMGKGDCDFMIDIVWFDLEGCIKVGEFGVEGIREYISLYICIG